jgi:two-component system response regulator AtoC
MSKLLLVDDDDQMRSVLALFLRRSGLTVLEAASCADANKVLGRESPDLLIVDYELPDGTAFDVLKGIEQRDTGEAAIVLTGLGTIELAVRAIKAGAEHFLTKPVDLESLEVLVRRTLDLQRTRGGRARARPSSI